ncbi:MAG: hypothetical protein NTW02_06100, partial [Cyanobium sp. LacPavin_0920_WC12_MAG_62_9]|nr:hypothetical protein [Cyanobium sp. LacPavin_0920_WC12_MAG_62_9]
ASRPLKVGGEVKAVIATSHETPCTRISWQRVMMVVQNNNAANLQTVTSGEASNLLSETKWFYFIATSHNRHHVPSGLTSKSAREWNR